MKQFHILIAAGAGLSTYWLSRNLNTVRRVVLRKGGKYVTIVTYGILGFTSKHTTKAVSHVSHLNNFNSHLNFKDFNGPISRTLKSKHNFVYTN